MRHLLRYASTTLVLLALASGCAAPAAVAPTPSMQPAPLPTSVAAATSAPTPLYTPVVLAPTGTVPPGAATVVTLAELANNPQPYVDTLVEVAGYAAEGVAYPACEPYISPLTNIRFADGVPLDRPRAQIEVKKVLLFPIFTQGTFGRRITLWGWLRHYHGPIGCGNYDAQGQAVFTDVPIDDLFYIDAVQMQYIDPIITPTP